MEHFVPGVLSLLGGLKAGWKILFAAQGGMVALLRIQSTDSFPQTNHGVEWYRDFVWTAHHTGFPIVELKNLHNFSLLVLWNVEKYHTETCTSLSDLRYFLNQGFCFKI